MSKAVIYSRTSCPWCVKAKQILTDKGVQFEEHVFGSEQFKDKQALQEKLGKPVSTVPQIVLDGQYIGGCTELAKHFGVAL
jgi:glutaredoxin 3